MGLTAVDIFKHLPKTNCRDCGVPTCLAFAMKVAQKQASLEDCPHVTEEAKGALAGESAPPIRLVTVGAGDRKLEIGQETVLFRHENTFQRPCGIAVMLDAGLDDAAVDAKLDHFRALEFDRVGMMLGISLIAVKGTGEGARLAAVAQKASEALGLPLILMGASAAELAPAASALKEARPLLHAATAENLEEMVALAKESGCPLVIQAAGPAELCELTPKAVEAGVQDLILQTEGASNSAILQDQTVVRRAALTKKERRLGYPTLVLVEDEDALDAAGKASLAIAKYAGIVVLRNDSKPVLLAAITARLNVYTDPQKPIQIEAKLYEVGEPTDQSPVLVTTNFSLTYFTVEGDVSASKVPVWVVVVDTEGTSVLTAWASEKFSAESIAAAIKSSGVEDKVGHRSIMLPGGVAVLKAKLEDESGWSVQVGPRESSGLPTVLRNWSAA
ncbi:MAG: acetyl-CoA decarbonylase/synthase complex subunit gamma [Armatimonadetes bacterium]|nr:acetyl-CoA decarbonylase/synthase complex subunit gamma [Armatimonadota bacterium]